MDATVIEFVNRFIEGLTIDSFTLIRKLLVQLRKLVLDLLRLAFQLLIVEAMLGLAINTQFFLIGLR